MTTTTRGLPFGPASAWSSRPRPTTTRTTTPSTLAPPAAASPATSSHPSPATTKPRGSAASPVATSPSASLTATTLSSTATPASAALLVFQISWATKHLFVGRRGVLLKNRAVLRASWESAARKADAEPRKKGRHADAHSSQSRARRECPRAEERWGSRASSRRIGRSLGFVLDFRRAACSWALEDRCRSRRTPTTHDTIPSTGFPLFDEAKHVLLLLV
mmetsp:Transcript_29311/g.89710  ORF Transcript_29311/g.89710 Transcript_29311/m.89710 type:complete len:219 (+) Transcript_29311:801-1457(+)